MARISNNPITSHTVDWTYDPETGYPFSGQSVQQYLRSNMEQIETRLTTVEIQNLLNLN